MFDILVFLGVIYFVGSALLKRVAAAQRKAGAPPQRSGRPAPSGAPPWMRPAPSAGTKPPAPEAQGQQAKPSIFGTLYEAIREELDPRPLESAPLPAPQTPTPLQERMAREQLFSAEGSHESLEGVSESVWKARPEEPDPAQPVALSGLGIRLDADTLVQGVIFSEILNRKGRGMRR